MERHTLLSKTAHEIMARKEELGELLSREEGKTLAEGIGEAARAGQIFEFFAGEALRLTGEIVPSVRPGLGVEITREPVGRRRHHHAVEFPDRHSGLEDRAGALLRQHGGDQAGRSGAGLHLGDLVDILQRDGLPKGVLNLVMGRGSVVGQAMLDSPDINAITFTGSVGTGKRVAEASIKVMRKFQLEMGGKNPTGRARRRRPRNRGRIARSTAPSSRPASAAPRRRA